MISLWERFVVHIFVTLSRFSFSGQRCCEAYCVGMSFLAPLPFVYFIELAFVDESVASVLCWHVWQLLSRLRPA